MAENICSCEEKLTWVNEYNRHYCHRCQKYPPTCSECKRDLSWIREYNRYFCTSCRRYDEPTKSTKKPKEDKIESHDRGKIEKEFNKLRERHQKGSLDKDTYEDVVKKMKFKDEFSRFWTIGANTGRWYCYDNGKWIESSPPQTLEGKIVKISRKRKKKAS
ncbi:MAG: hypothetical protein NWE86_04475 [Candidatus Bathyarchaeota archaeon]|nr:hypothetical protein [Candidatus Bathyarchaeota archaeon]